MLHKSLSSDVVRAIDDATDSLLEGILHRIAQGDSVDFETLHSEIEDSRVGEASICDLDTDDQLDLLDCYADELGIVILQHTSIADLRVKIAETAAAVLSSLARTQAMTALHGLESLIDAEELELRDVSMTNPYGSTRHDRESDEGSSIVYHYRNVEVLDADVLELDLWQGRSIYLVRAIDPAANP